MNEYDVRKKAVCYINDNLETVIERYYDIYKDNIGFLLYYPMINLEKEFKDAIPSCTGAIIDREITNWFVSEILKKKIRKNLLFTFKESEFNYYVTEIYPQLANLYSDYRLAREINDNSSIGKCKVEEVENKKYNITTPLVTKAFEGGNAYFIGMHDFEERNVENELANEPLKYILTNYIEGISLRKDIGRINRLMIDIDPELYKICIDRVNLDTSKMGESLKSEVINKKQTLNEFLGFLFYLSVLKVAAFDIEFKYSRKDVPYNNSINVIGINWLKNKIKKLTNMNEILIKKYIDYFTYKSEGTIVDFPLIKNKDYLIIIPSSIMLNDWQFSIPNGHYAKKVEFKKKENNVSKSIIDMIANSCKKFTNIKFASEYYYEIKEGGKILKSDIDAAIYDTNTNNILIIECKWKHNHYIDDTDENYVKIQNSLNKIYNDQLSKHKKFLDEDIDNINKLFGNEIKLNENTRYSIQYLAVDKRSDLHIDDKHMIAVYALLGLFNIFSEANTLKLDKVIEKIKEAKTKVEYFMIGEPKEFCIDSNEGIYIYSDELYGGFDEYFKK